MKKVLIIAGKLCIGGAEKVARDIGYYADKTKYDIHYLVFGDEVHCYEQELTDVGCKIIHMDPPSDNHYKYYKSIRTLFCNEKYDIVHSHTMFSSGWAMIAGKKCGVPVRIAHSHTIRGHEERGLIKSIYENTMRRVINKYATHCIGCGLSAGYWLFGKKEFKEKGIVIFNGIDLDSFKYDPEKRNRLREQLLLDNKFVIGHVGHFADVKNQQYLIKLLPDLIRKNKNTVLMLLGDGETNAEMKQLVKSLNVEKCVLFTGNVTNVGDYLNAMDVFAFPSKYEGMPLSLIEAQANGLPCVISEKIPKDVYLTDLITGLPITEESRDMWLNKIEVSKRVNSECYYDIIDEAGFSVNRMLAKIYDLYDGGIV